MIGSLFKIRIQKRRLALFYYPFFLKVMKILVKNINYIKFRLFNFDIVSRNNDLKTIVPHSDSRCTTELGVFSNTYRVHTEGNDYQTNISKLSNSRHGYGNSTAVNEKSYPSPCKIMVKLK